MFIYKKEANCFANNCFFAYLCSRLVEKVNIKRTEIMDDYPADSNKR